MPQKAKIFCTKCGSELRVIFADYLYRCDRCEYTIAVFYEEGAEAKAEAPPL